MKMTGFRGKSRFGEKKKHERMVGIGLLLMFGISGIMIAIVSNMTGIENGGIDDTIDEDVDLPTFEFSGTNPNLTREGYPVTLSVRSPQLARMFDPAYRGSENGGGAIWGLCVNDIRIVYYGFDASWHETSFQVNEIGWRWVVNGSDEYIHTNSHNTPNGLPERPDSILEEMQWQKGYIPSYFYPELSDKFFPDGPWSAKGSIAGQPGGCLPYETSLVRMNNWPEYHHGMADEMWTMPDNTSQVRGAVDNDDEIVFLAKNGRQVGIETWYRRDLWPRRWEIAIIDPVDGGHSWVYVYYNPTTPATQPTPVLSTAGAIPADHCRMLEYIAPGEVDSISYDPSLLKITGMTYQVTINPEDADDLSEMKLVVPGLLPADLSGEFPKDFIMADGWSYLGSSTPYDTVDDGFMFKFGLQGTWYDNDGPPGLGNPDGGVGSRDPRKYDETKTHIGYFHHHGNPDQTTNGSAWVGSQHPAYNYNNGWKYRVNPQNSHEIAYYDHPTSYEGAISIRFRWERYDRQVVPVPATSGWYYEGYWFMDGMLEIYDGGAWKTMFAPWESNTANDGDVAFQPQKATIDGPCMVYLERPQWQKATLPLSWTYQLDSSGDTLIGLLVGNDGTSRCGACSNFDEYMQSDIIAYPNSMEISHNQYPAPTLASEFQDYEICDIHHMNGYFKGIHFSSTLPTTTRLWLGRGGTAADGYSIMNRFVDTVANRRWIIDRNFDHFYNIQQLDSENDEVNVAYHPWNWMGDVAWQPAGKLPTYVTLNYDEMDDAGRYYGPENTMTGGETYTGDYHPWWDHDMITVGGIDYFERWLAKETWRNLIIRRPPNPPIQYAIAQTRFQPIPRTPSSSPEYWNVCPDWMIADIPGSGHVWIYMPVREIREMQSNASLNWFQPPAGSQQDVGLFFKDTNIGENVREAGIFVKNLALGKSVIPFTLTYTFGDFGITDLASANQFGQREWVRNRFRLSSIIMASGQQKPPTTLESFQPAGGDDIFCKDGDNVVLDLLTSWDLQIPQSNVSVGFDHHDVIVDPPILIYPGMYRHRISFNVAQVTSQPDNVGPGLPPVYDFYYVNVSLGGIVATCGLLLDNQAPTPAIISLPAETRARVVVLDWSASPGADNADDTFPLFNGINEYTIKRNGVPIAYLPHGTNMFIDDNGGSLFNDGEVLNYELVSKDWAGNQASRYASTIIKPGIDPTPEFNSETGTPPNQHYVNRSFSLYWDDESPYSTSITSVDLLWSNTSPASGFSTLQAGINPALLSWTFSQAMFDNPSLLANTYWFKLHSHIVNTTVDSAPWSVIIDKHDPIPAMVDWPYGTLYAPSMNVVPIDITGSNIAIDPGFISAGDPDNTGSGIDYYQVMRRENPSGELVFSGPFTQVSSNVPASVMESTVFYDSGLVYGHSYQYEVWAWDQSGRSVRSAPIQFEFYYYDPLGPILEIMSMTTNQSMVDVYSQFEVEVEVGNIGMTAGAPTDLWLNFTYAGIDMTATAFTVSAPTPTLGPINPGAIETYTFVVTAHGPLTGFFDIEATVTWTPPEMASESLKLGSIEVTNASLLIVGNVTGPPDIITNGTVARYWFNVMNPNLGSATILDSGLVIRDGFTTMVNFTILPITTHSSIAGGATVTFEYDIIATGNSPPGTHPLFAFVNAVHASKNVTGQSPIRQINVRFPIPEVVVFVAGNSSTLVAGDMMEVTCIYQNQGASIIRNWTGTLEFANDQLMIVSEPLLDCWIYPGYNATQTWIVQAITPVLFPNETILCSGTGWFDDGVNVSNIVQAWSASTNSSYTVQMENIIIPLVIHEVWGNSTLHPSSPEQVYRYRFNVTNPNYLDLAITGAGLVITGNATTGDFFITPIAPLNANTSQWTISAGMTVTFEYTVELTGTTPLGTSLVNAFVQGENMTPDASCWSALVAQEIQIRRKIPEIIISVRGNATILHAGQTMWVTCEYQNTGPVDVYGWSGVLSFATGQLAILSGPTPATVTIPTGGNALQTWVLQAIDPVTMTNDTVDCTGTGTFDDGVNPVMPVSATSGTRDHDVRLDSAPANTTTRPQTIASIVIIIAFVTGVTGFKVVKNPRHGRRRQRILR